MLATLTVSVIDDGDIDEDDGKLTLREAIAYVNLDAIPISDATDHINTFSDTEPFGTNDTILFAPSLDGQIITFAQDYEYDSLTITNPVKIDATMLPNSITIDANKGWNHIAGDFDGTSVFTISPDTTNMNSGEIHQVTLAGLTITGGDTAGDGGGIYYSYDNSSWPDFALTIRDTQFAGNHAEDNGGGLYIWTSAGNMQLDINGSTFENNLADAGGGANIYGLRSATITDTKFMNNKAIGNFYTSFDGGGGGLFAKVDGSSNAADLTIIDSTFQDNEAHANDPNYQSHPGTFGGGGIHVMLRGAHNDPARATFNLKDSTVSNNLVDSQISGDTANVYDGGGVWVNSKYGAFNGMQSTISGNSALFGAGGGLWISSKHNPEMVSNLDHMTITNNVSPDGGGLYSDPLEGVVTTLYHTIVSGNRVETAGSSAANNIGGNIEDDSSYNLIGPGDVDKDDLTGPGNKEDADNDPDLMDLAFYGGPTKTHMPYEASEVINAGNVNAANLPRYDQRGRPFDRVYDEDGDPGTSDIIDIGAVEYGIGDPAGAPRVVDIVISGSKSVHDDYSFSEAFDDGDDGTHEFTTVPVGGADTVEVVFSERIKEFEPNYLYLYGGYTKIKYSVSWNIVDFDYDEDTFTARWRFDDPADGNDDPNPFPADMMYLRLGADGDILDMDDNKLDGNWDFPMKLADQSPTSFPSGDGDAGDVFRFTFVILPGDVNLDNIVDNADYAIWLANVDHDARDKTFQQGDVDGDGDVDDDDYAILDSLNLGLDFTSWYNY